MLFAMACNLLLLSNAGINAGCCKLPLVARVISAVSCCC